MKFSYMTLALCLIAFALAHALPEPESHETNYHANAKKRVVDMLQTGKDDNACRELAKTMRREVTDNIAAQQKTLDALPKGNKCADEGQGLINDAKAKLGEAQNEQKLKTKALAKAKSTKIDFGTFAYGQLTAGNCGAFFDQKVWKDAHAAVTEATARLFAANVAVKAAGKAIDKAGTTAANMILKCRCTAKKLLAASLKTMNKGVKAANTKAWKEAAHMVCVLDGKDAKSCSVPALPSVKPVKVSDKVQASCKIAQIFASGSQVTGGSSKDKGKTFTVFKMKKPTVYYANDGAKYYDACKAQGMLPIGCGGADDCASKFMKGGHCISMPDTWGCIMSSSIEKEAIKPFGDYAVTFCAGGDGGGCAKTRNTRSPYQQIDRQLSTTGQAGNGQLNSPPGGGNSYYPLCGSYGKYD